MHITTVEIIKARWSKLERRFLPAYAWDSDPLTFWRERILFIICFLAAALGPFALIPSIWVAYQEGLWNVILLDSTAYITSAIIIIGRDWPLKVRTGIVAIVLYILGAFLLLFLGPVGAGYIWLFGASVIISVIIGFESALWTLVLNAFIFLSIAVFMAYGRLQWMMQYDNVIEKWLVMSVNFLLLNSFVTLTTATMLSGLGNALSGEQNSKRSLQESEERFRAISEFSHHGICIIDETARITWVNNRMLEISGYSREQALSGGRFPDFVAPESLDFVMNNYLLFLNGGDYQHHYHFNIIRADGENRLIEKYMTDYMDKHRCKHLIISMMDVTDQKRTENTILSSEKKFRQLFNGINDGLFVNYGPIENLSGRFIEVNDVACRRLGYSRDELLQMTPMAIHAPEAGNILQQRMAESQSSEFVFWESTQFTRDGRHIPVEITSQVFDLNGEPVVLSAARDISERKQAELEKAKLENQLQQAQKMEAIGSLAGGIAHDLNNILFPISGLAELLLEEMPSKDPAYESLEQILKSARRGSDLVKQILAFSRQSSLQKLPLRIQPILKEVLKLLRAAIPQNIEITCHVASDCGMIFADPTQMHQVLMNLITNAYHAVEQTGGTIDIALKAVVFENDELHFRAMRSGRYACITVSDTGIGIDQTLVDRIFEPYFTTKEQGKGTGLGLSVVHGIIKECGGDIQVNSEVGKGTVFNVFLPLLEDAGDKKVAAAAGKYPTGSERILLVDDESPIAFMVEKMLEKLGYQVTVRTNSPDALAVFRAGPDRFDLVISDRGMPNMTGDQLAAELISIRPGISIIICTGFSDEKDEARARGIGVKGFLMKPVAMGDLAAMLRNVLDTRHTGV